MLASLLSYFSYFQLFDAENLLLTLWPEDGHVFGGKLVLKRHIKSCKDIHFL